MPERVGRRADYGVDPRMIWPHLYFAVKDHPKVAGRLDPRLFSSTFNGLEASEPDVGARVTFLVRWLRQQVGDDKAVDEAYARAVEMSRARRSDEPPATYLQAQRRGEALLRADHERGA